MRDLTDPGTHVVRIRLPFGTGCDSLSVFITGNEIYMVGCRITSVMVAQDARKGRRV